jgi:hypothetical protein
MTIEPALIEVSVLHPPQLAATPHEQPALCFGDDDNQ